MPHLLTFSPTHPTGNGGCGAVGRGDVEYLVLSDSALLLESPEGTVTALRDDRLSRLPRSSLATDALVDATVRNKEGGFFTAAADPSVAARAVTGALPRGEVRALAALTDGATRWVEKFREGDWTDCFRFVRKEGAEALVDRVRMLERADAEERKYSCGGARRMTTRRLCTSSCDLLGGAAYDAVQAPEETIRTGPS